MIIVDGGPKKKGGCGVAAAIGLMVAIFLGHAPGILFPLAIIAFIIFAVRMSRQNQEVEGLEQELDPLFQAPRQTGGMMSDPRLAQISNLRNSIVQLLSKHESHPLLGTMREEIHDEADGIERKAKQLIDAKKNILSFLNQSDANQNEILRLEYDVKNEPSDRIRATLEATLDRKKAELDNVQRLTEQLRYLDALLDQAEATMAELHTRIGLAISTTEEYIDPRSRLALAEASDQLRDVSDAMRETLKEIG